MALEALSDEGEAEWDLRAVRGLYKGVRLASFDKKNFFSKIPRIHRFSPLWKQIPAEKI